MTVNAHNLSFGEENQINAHNMTFGAESSQRAEAEIVDQELRALSRVTEISNEDNEFTMLNAMEIDKINTNLQQ